jgi:hypothetical protein
MVSGRLWRNLSERQQRFKICEKAMGVSAMKSNWHVATAAEATAAAQFARLGLDVSVQYGASQPEYDLIITDGGGRMLKVSVKGSKDGGWGLSQTQLTALRKNYKPGTIMCFVQFKDSTLGDLPRLYLAWPREVCELLKSARGGKGDTTLKERDHGHYSSIPDDWKMTKQRADDLFEDMT